MRIGTVVVTYITWAHKLNDKQELFPVPTMSGIGNHHCLFTSTIT